ncbi:MAG: radical SAM protein, partial [Leadbetterella sp.]
MKKYRLFLRKLSLPKVLNSLGLVFQYFLSRYLGSTRHSFFPVALAIEPTTSCNLRCPECPSGLRSFTRNTGMLDDALFSKIIQEHKRTLMYLTFYFQGEPYIHKNFLKMVKIAHTEKIFTSTSTNAHYLNVKTAEDTVLSGLDRIIISI